MSRNITTGVWYAINNEEHFNTVQSKGEPRVRYGKYYGPGRYYLLEYSQRCPRGCCFDDVNELMSESEAKDEIKEAIEHLQGIIE